MTDAGDRVDAGVDPAGPAIAMDGTPSAEEALERLLRGNERFVTAHERHRRQDERWLATLGAGQRPFATILGCADSRIPPELVFDQGFGDLFVVRVAGHVVGKHVLGSVEYAVSQLHTHLVMVLGHENCGAVAAALDRAHAADDDAPGVHAVLDALEPAVAGVDRSLDRADRIACGVEANVRFAVRRLREAPWLADRLRAERALVVGAVVGFDTGRVRLLD